MRTLTGYGIGVVIVFAILNGIAWLLGNPVLHRLNVFSAGFVLGCSGRVLRFISMDIAKSPDRARQLCLTREDGDAQGGTAD